MDFKLIALFLAICFAGAVAIEIKLPEPEPIELQEECKDKFEEQRVHELLERTCVSCAQLFKEEDDFHANCRANCYKNSHMTKCILAADPAKYRQ
ncbi:unnamed protein product [Bursaphelenchus xylophilus]|uniref:(pine wood nematode) hypothetical protein n=1 Tax=Bursaphelenchus xylophilus TaxID=6326 RepID=A0A1I7SFH5_BURXY|nr:unnamed protein product [Bursaphelenchus xylophilus]CAG9079023.1 unnamed protein product [Bursaphelenchus xylophilus]